MSTYKASAFNFLFNSVNAVIMIVNGIVMVPIYFHYMTVSTYGAWLATGNVIAMLGLIESGFASVITQKMSVSIVNNDDVQFRKQAGANIITAILFASVIFISGLAISPFVADWVNVDASDSGAIRISFIIALIASCVSLMVSLFGAFPQVWQDTKTVGIINTVSSLVAIASLVSFLLLGFGVVSIALSYLVRACINLIFQGLWILRNWHSRGLLTPLFDYSSVKDLFKACIYPFLSKLSGVFMGHSQSFIIASFMNPALAAVYDITTKVCTVACTFVSQFNGSFFALFSLTMATKDRDKINDVFKKTSTFFLVSLLAVGLYSMCFSEPIIRYWVGLDKFGGALLLAIAVFAKIVSQIRSYLNNIIYTGGLINKSAKLDILCMAVYLLILFIIIKKTQVYAIPIATALSCLIFLVWYLRILKNDLHIDVKAIIRIALKGFMLILPFLLVHFVINIDYNNIILYGLYFIIFSVFYCVVVYFTNQEIVNLFIDRIHHRK